MREVVKKWCKYSAYSLSSLVIMYTCVNAEGGPGSEDNDGDNDVGDDGFLESRN